MKRRWLVTLTVIVVMLFALASWSRSPQQQAPSTNEAMNVPYDQAKWQPVVPELGNDSPQVSILRVDARTGATQLLIHCPKKMHIPMHWHSANETHTMIRGESTFEHGGKSHKLGPGGFNYIPAKSHHQAWVSDDALVFITVDGPWDVNWVNGPPGKAELGRTAPTDH